MEGAPIDIKVLLAAQTVTQNFQTDLPIPFHRNMLLTYLDRSLSIISPEKWAGIMREVEKPVSVCNAIRAPELLHIISSTANKRYLP